MVVIVTDPWRGREGAATDAIVMVLGLLWQHFLA